jgi:hypothetical protein
LFQDNALVLPRSSSQVEKEQWANQALYNLKGTSYYGYSGIGYGGATEDNAVSLSVDNSTNAVFYARPNVPRRKVWLVEPSAEETLQAEGAHNNLQGSMEAVPMPEPSKLLVGHVEPAPSTSDRSVVIISPGTREMWEMEHVGVFEGGPHVGEWKCTMAGYCPDLSSFNGVWPETQGWGISASGLGLIGGNLSHKDFVRVLRGGKIGHGLGCAVLVANGHVAPAIRSDSKEKGNTYELNEKEEPNPAFGMVDSIREGLRMAFPAASRASEFGITTPIAAALYETMREYPLVVRDRSGSPVQFFMNDLGSLGSIYSDVSIDFLRGTTISGINKYIETKLAEQQPGMHDPTLPKIEETFFGKGSVWELMPWRDLEQLEPATS